MKQSEYTNVFRRLRWDEQRRSEIEAQLCRPSAQKKSKPIHTEEVILMPLEPTHRSIKAGFRPVAAVLSICLIAGIGIFAAAMLRRNDTLHPQTSTPDAHSIPDTPGVTYQVIGDHVEGDLQTKFSGSDHNVSLMVNESINGYVSTSYEGGNNRCYGMKAENGWYHVEYVYSDDGSHYDCIRYYDEATGEDVPLCAKPDCTHNNEYCVAANTKYFGEPTAYYDGYLYGLSGDSDTQQKEREDNKVWYSDWGELSLVRYAPDGTELTKLVSLSDAAPESLEKVSFDSVEIIGHRGALWISAGFCRSYVIEKSAVVDGEMVEVASEWLRETGYGLFHYDIASGTLTPVIYQPLTEYELSDGCSIPSQLQAVGDYVYFRKANTNWADPYNGDCVYRVNIRTGAVEVVIDTAMTFYAIWENKIVYLKTNWLAAAQEVWIKDLHTGEERLFLEEDDYAFSVQCTADYVFVVRNTDWCEIEIYDWEGNLLQSIEQPLKQESIDAGDTELSVYSAATVVVSGDTLYAILDGIHWSTDLQAAVENGTTDWKLIAP